METTTEESLTGQPATTAAAPAAPTRAQPRAERVELRATATSESARADTAEGELATRDKELGTSRTECDELRAAGAEAQLRAPLRIAAFAPADGMPASMTAEAGAPNAEPGTAARDCCLSNA